MSNPWKGDLDRLSGTDTTGSIVDIINQTCETLRAYDNTVTKTLNVDKIKDLDDVKRVLKFMNITAKTGAIQSNGYNEVKDLFED